MKYHLTIIAFLVFVNLLIFGCKKEAKDNYDCIDGDCVSHHFGEFSSLTECQSNCHPPIFYTCDDGSCVEDENGFFNSLSQCQKYCESENWLNNNLVYDSIYDIDSNKYATITIGSQVWMVENLKTTRYSNGDSIPYYNSSSLGVGAWKYYNNNSMYNLPYGKQYNWLAINDVRNICPNGWHVPSLQEWIDLIDFLTSEGSGSLEMRSEGDMYWTTTWGNNLSGFSGLPGGISGTSSSSYHREMGYWWSSSEEDSLLASDVFIINGATIPIVDSKSKFAAMSCRCILD